MFFKVKTSIKKKILLSISVVVIATLVASGIFSYNYFSMILKDQTVHDYGINLQLNAKQLDYIFEDVQKLAQEFTRDNSIQGFLKNEEKAQDNDKISSLIERMKYINNMRNYVDSSIIITNDKKVYWSSFPYDDYFKDKLREDWYVDYKANSKFSGFSQLHDMFKGGNNSVKVFSFITSIKSDQEYDKVIGELIINIKFDYLRNFLETESKEFDGYALLDGLNNVMYSSSRENPPVYLSKLINSLPTVREKNTYVENSYEHVIINEPLNNGWKLIAFNSNANIFNKISHIIYFFIILIFISIIVIIFIVAKILGNFMNPIETLTSSMKKVASGDLNTRVDIKSSDELETMGDVFNIMTEQLEGHLQKTIEYEKNKRKMEFELLLSQINPHFIYNTLNTVTYIARKQKNYDIVEMVNAFIVILQDAIKLGKSGDELFTTVKQEVDVVSNYITIQKYRYREKFSVEWFIDDDVEEILMPKTILQPIIENSIYHGISPMEGSGTIKISINKVGERINIEIQDNGLGINEDTLQNILLEKAIVKKGDSLRSIGLSNIFRRLKHLYGEESYFNIESTESKGTKVIIKFPVKMDKVN